MSMEKHIYRSGPDELLWTLDVRRETSVVHRLSSIHASKDISS